MARTDLQNVCFICMVKGRKVDGCSNPMGVTKTKHEQKWLEQRPALQVADSAWKIHVSFQTLR